MIACIACGGMIEIALLSMGLGLVLRLLRKRHDKKECKCCKDKDHKESDK